MASWSEFEKAEPEFAGRVRTLFEAHKHHTMATIRRDGSPRISGTEVELADGEVVLGMMQGARRVFDLRRDPRLAIHSHSADPPEDDHASWTGDAKISGRGIEVEDPEITDGSHRIRVDIAEVVFTGLGTPADHLVIETWRPGQGRVRQERR
jgi:Pyridoxamine 5'-phosphate oxidase